MTFCTSFECFKRSKQKWPQERTGSSSGDGIEHRLDSRFRSYWVLPNCQNNFELEAPPILPRFRLTRSLFPRASLELKFVSIVRQERAGWFPVDRQSPVTLFSDHPCYLKRISHFLYKYFSHYLSLIEISFEDGIFCHSKTGVCIIFSRLFF